MRIVNSLLDSATSASVVAVVMAALSPLMAAMGSDDEEM